MEDIVDYIHTEIHITCMQFYDNYCIVKKTPMSEEKVEESIQEHLKYLDNL